MPSQPDPDETGAYVPPPPIHDRNERFAPGTILASRYRIVAPLGRGGMGEVYRADDLSLGQPVALKFLPTRVADDQDRLARFRKEVALARKVSHPNVCRVYDLVEPGGDSFLTMEFVDGEDLSSVLKRLGRVPEEKGVEVARQLCSALAAVHDQDLLHRDLKPANVMLDGRGRVRLTDFGLAAATQELSATDVRSGTPIYQAPEQRAGKEVTVRSDLYSLGLVLYELFTGRRPFAKSDPSTPPSKPSSHVSGLNPAVEEAILRCLEPDPGSRPRSAAAVLARLPGGDPLAAALAAGETPSPRLVADASVEGTLRPAVAWALLAAVVALLVVIAGLNDRLKAHRHVPFPATAVLEEKAARMVRDLGYTDPPADTIGGFEMPPEHLRYVERHDGRPVVPVDQMAACRPALLVYWYRQGPGPILPVQAYGRSDASTSRNPPDIEPGMVTLRMDTRGRLVGFLAVPDPSAVHPAGPLDWDAVLRLAELDGSGVLRPDPDAQPTPPVFADQTQAWSGKYPERPDLAVRVEAAAYRGRLVFFHIAHPDWGDPPPDKPIKADSELGVRVAIGAILWLTLAGGAIVAVRNVRRGRADVRGGLRLAALTGSLSLIHELSVNLHFPNWGMVIPLALSQFIWSLWSAGLVLGSYLALEPVVRRRCPHRLISWTRLMNGRWRDPVVGRHLLIGLLAGLVCSLDWPTTPFWPATDWAPSVAHLTFFTRPLGQLAGNLTFAVMVTWVYAGVFAVVLMVVRREWVAVALLAAFLMSPVILEGRHSVLTQTFSLLRVAIVFGLFLRLGVLPAIAAYVGINVAMHTPLSLDGSAWYFGASLIYFTFAIGLAGLGAYTATEGRLFGLSSGEPGD